MKKKRCTQVMDIFLQLDKNERLPLPATIHLLACKKCRTQVRLCTLAEKHSAELVREPLPSSDALVHAVMEKIDPSSVSNYFRPISLRNWIVSGIAMIVLMLAFGLSTSPLTDPKLLIAFYAVFGGVVTAYCSLFIGSNLDFFIKKISLDNPLGRLLAELRL